MADTPSEGTLEAAPSPQAPVPLPATATDAERLVHVRAHWAGIEPNSPIYGLFFGNIRLVSATNGRVLARLPVAAIHVNSKQILHGAVSAALVDWAGGMAIASTGRHGTGVSVDIHISYVSGARAGDELEIEAWVQRVGRSLAYTSVEIRKKLAGGGDGKELDESRPTNGPVVASGSHTKYVNFPGK
ncbi:thioesterase family protein [Grosmannia clavigera kw1407]|uniref:Thioesterase family protein n=1 Tax=Grosmannia clavigera (strain kw1407 / UAMH 11150) TaxID=655863 RepID=F0XIQ7_GROCL|nr:thioesterase family protein [Grosmannia clavigera kw1407]EFX02222.1 thioesterase family protein [Grosmannia clavigera kw1407]